MKTLEEQLLSRCWTPPSVLYKEGEGSRKTMKKQAELKSSLYESWKVGEVPKLPSSQAQGWSTQVQEGHYVQQTVKIGNSQVRGQ